MKTTRNICFLICCVVYEAIAMAVLHISSDSPNTLWIGLFTVIAVALAYLSVSPTFRREKNDSYGEADDLDSLGTDEDFLLVSDLLSSYRLYVTENGYVFKRIDKNDDDYVNVNEITKKDIAYTFSNIKSVSFYDSDEIGYAGEIIIDHGKKDRFNVSAFENQEKIDSFFKDVKYKKKNVREKSNTAAAKYNDETRKPIAFISYISKLLMPLCAISVFFINDAEKPWYFWVVSILSLIGFIIGAYINIVFPLIACPNEKADTDDIDVIGGSLVISVVAPAITLFFMCFSLTYANLAYSIIILCVPTVLITIICYLMNSPVTESEKASRVFVVAGTVIFCLMLINSVHFTGIESEQGRVKYIDTTGKGTSDAMVISDSGKEELYDIHFFEGNISEGDSVIIESKKGLLGIKTKYIRQDSQISDK